MYCFCQLSLYVLLYWKMESSRVRKCDEKKIIFSLRKVVHGHKWIWQHRPRLDNGRCLGRSTLLVQVANHDICREEVFDFSFRSPKVNEVLWSWITFNRCWEMYHCNDAVYHISSDFHWLTRYLKCQGSSTCWQQATHRTSRGEEVCHFRIFWPNTRKNKILIKHQKKQILIKHK